MAVKVKIVFKSGHTETLRFEKFEYKFDAEGVCQVTWTSLDDKNKLGWIKPHEIAAIVDLT